MCLQVKYNELTDVAFVHSRNNLEVGAVLPETFSRVERNGVDWLSAVGGSLKITALKVPCFGECKSQYLEDIVALIGG